MEKDNGLLSQKTKQRIKRIILSILSKLLIISMPIIVILSIISAAIWYINEEEGTWRDDEKGNPGMYTNNTTLSSTNGIEVDKEKLIKEALLSKGYSQERIDSMTEQEIIIALDIQNKLKKTVTSINELTHAEILWCTNEIYSKYLKKPEDLQKLLDAELITQYPKIDGLQEGKLNGIVEFVRYSTNPDTNQEEVRTLKWISTEEFTNKMTAYQETGNTDILNYFTLDESGNVKIATWMREEGSFYSNDTTLQTDRKKIRSGTTGEAVTSNYDSRYTITKNDAASIEATYVTYIIQETLIDYKPMIQKYTLPFEYLWALLVTTKSDDFVLNLADLVYNSEIKIGIYDNISKTVNTDIEKYREEFREKYEEYEDGSLVEKRPSDKEWDTEEYDYEIRNVITTYDENIQYELLYANTWIVEVSTQYENTITAQEPTSDINSDLDENWTDDISPNPYVKTWTRTEPHTDPVDGSTYTETINCKSNLYKYKRTINHEYISERVSTISKYQKLPTQNLREKTDTDENTDNNFVKIAIKDANATTAFANLGTVNLLKNILENSSNTKDMVPLTKHLIYKITKNENYNINFSFSYYESIASFNTISNGIYGGNIQEKVWFALKDLGLSDIAVAGAMGNIHYESGSFNPTLVEGGYTEDNGGIGLCQWTNYPRNSGKGRNAQLKAYAASKGTTWQDEDTQVEFLVAELTNGNGFAEKQLLTSSSSYDGVRHNPSEWKDAEDVEVATRVFCYCFERPNADAARSSMNTRIEYAKMYLAEFSGREKPVGSSEDYANADKVTVMGYTFPHYYQRNYAYRMYGVPGKTISSSGCGPTSMAMIVAGLTKDQTVNPDSFVTALENYFPNYTSYYANGAGSIYEGICNSRFLQTFYNLKSRLYPSYEETLTALAEGKCAIARVEGHVLALVPVTEEQRQQGYVFYVMDSASGLDGPYRNQEELRQMVNIKRPGRGFGFAVKAIIEPM